MMIMVSVESRVDWYDLSLLATIFSVEVDVVQVVVVVVDGELRW